jgi:hypothetical protein
LIDYIGGASGWRGVPVAVCLGSWRNLWRRKWYHQRCCGVYTDKVDLAGRWVVFGAPPPHERRGSRDDA